MSNDEEKKITHYARSYSRIFTTSMMTDEEIDSLWNPAAIENYIVDTIIESTIHTKLHILVVR